jgi:transketolase
LAPTCPDRTRKAFGNALVAADANRPDMVSVDGEVSDSTFTEEFNKA